MILHLTAGHIKCHRLVCLTSTLCTGSSDGQHVMHRVVMDSMFKEAPVHDNTIQSSERSRVKVPIILRVPFSSSSTRTVRLDIVMRQYRRLDRTEQTRSLRPFSQCWHRLRLPRWRGRAAELSQCALRTSRPICRPPQTRAWPSGQFRPPTQAQQNVRQACHVRTHAKVGQILQTGWRKLGILRQQSSCDRQALR